MNTKTHTPRIRRCWIAAAATLLGAPAMIAGVLSAAPPAQAFPPICFGGPFGTPSSCTGVALALSEEDGAIGWAVDYPNAHDAETEAVNQCSNVPVPAGSQGGNCGGGGPSADNGCVAAVSIPDPEGGWSIPASGFGTTAYIAETNALAANGGQGWVVGSACADDSATPRSGGGLRTREIPLPPGFPRFPNEAPCSRRFCSRNEQPNWLSR